MSCQACHDFQETDQTSFFRWKNANVEIRACEYHLSEIFDVLREYQKREVWKNKSGEERFKHT